jgi:hypothetical protein
LQTVPGVEGAGSQTIEEKLFLLESLPGAGRPFDDEPDLREQVIPFGDSGYVALYRHEPALDSVFVLTFRRQKEAGYAEQRTEDRGLMTEDSPVTGRFAPANITVLRHLSSGSPFKRLGLR